MRITKKFFAYLLTLCMILAMLPGIEVQAADSVIQFSGTWNELDALLKSSCSIRLNADVKASSDSTYLSVGSGAVVNLDLNGHTIDRNLSSAVAGGYVFSLDGTLNVSGDGYIKGGNNSANGGGVYISNTGALTLDGGTIMGNTAKNGGGVYVNYSGSFTMNAGAITGNTAQNYGGGVCGIASSKGYSTFTMNDGTVSNNTAVNGGGIAQYASGTNVSTISTIPIINIAKGTVSSNKATKGGGIYHGIGKVTLSGGRITENTATDGAGIYSDVNKVYNLGSYSGAEITNNTATGNGGGVYIANSNKDAFLSGGNVTANTAGAAGGGIYVKNGKTMAVAGQLVVTGNKAGVNDNNVYLYASSKTSSAKIIFNADNELSSGSNINVTMSNLSYSTLVADTNLNEGYLKYFHPDSAGVHFAATASAINCHELTETASTSTCKAYWYCSTCELYYSDNKGASQIANLDTWKKTPAADGGGLISGSEVHTHVKGTYFVANAATCTTKGNVAYYLCTGCNEKLDSKANVIQNVETAINSTAHSYGQWNKSSDGKKCVRTCTYNILHTETTTHSGLSCSKCGWKHAHTVNAGTKVAANAPTCTDEGNVEYYLCSGCSAKVDANGNEIANYSIPIDENSHKFGSWTMSGDKTKCTRTCSYNPAHTETANHTGVSCANCGWSTHVHSVNLSKKVAAKEPTCTTKGNVEYYICNSCSAKLDANAKELSTVDVPINESAHDYGDWEVSSDEKSCVRTCSYNPLHTKSTEHTQLYCNNCGWSHTHSIDYSSHVVATAATCTSKGNVEYYRCSGCSAKLAANKTVLTTIYTDIDSTAHNWGSWVTSGDGSYCSRECTYNGSHTQKNTHTGLSCDVCKWKHSHSIDSSSHVAARASDCTTKGNVEYYICNGCDAKLDKNANVLTDVYLELNEDAHEWKYTSNGAIVKAVCNRNDSHYILLTLDISSTVYSGNAQTAGLTNEAAFKGKTDAVIGTIEYYQTSEEGAVSGGNKVSEAKNVGNYYASVKVTDKNNSSNTATAVKAFTISQSQLQADNAAFNEYKKTKNDLADMILVSSDSDAVRQLVEAAKSEIAATSYDENKTLEQNKSVLDGIITKLESDVQAQRQKELEEQEAEELAANKKAFLTYKSEAEAKAAGKFTAGDSQAVQDLISAAKKKIENTNYDESMTLSKNKAVVDAILTKLDSDISAQKKLEYDEQDKEALEANKAKFLSYKEKAEESAGGKALDSDSEAVRKLIDTAKAAIASLTYDESKSLGDNTAAIDAILTDLEASVAAQREKELADKQAAETLAASKSEVKAYNSNAQKTVDSKAKTGDSEAVKKLIATAKTAIALLAYDESKSLEENRAAIDAILARLDKDIAAQRAADAKNPSKHPGKVPDVEPAPLKKGDTKTDKKTKARYKVTNSSTTRGEVIYLGSTNKNVTTVTIPATVKLNNVTYKVTAIDAQAFKGKKKLTRVVIGSNVKKIGKKAFYGCTSLKSVKLGKNVVSIGANAFTGCRKLSSVKLDSKLTTIGNNAFKNCTALKKLTIPLKVKSIGAGAFYKCTALVKITIPAKVTTIGKNSFYGCKRLRTITIKTTKLTSKKVGTNAFKGISSKARIKVPSKKLKAYKKLLKSKGIKGKKQKITK